MAYQTRFKTKFAARDGHKYSVELQRRGYTGPTYEYEAPGEPVVYRLGEQSRTIPLLTPAEVEVRVYTHFDSKLRDVLDPDPRAWRMLLNRDGSEIWRGFITSETFSSRPYLPANVVSVTARDGIGLLQDKPYDYATQNTGRRTFLGVLFDQLDAIAADYPLHTLCYWYPYRASSALSGDPLAELAVDLRTWEEDLSDTVTLNRHEILTQIAAGFNLEVFQGFDGWYAAQPVELMLGSADLYTYDASRSQTGRQAPRTQDADQWAGLLRDDRAGQTRHSTASATYDFIPDPENLIQEPGFEPDDPDASTPTWQNVKDYWSFRSTPLLDDGSESESDLDAAGVSIQRRSYLMGSSTESDSYALAARFKDDNSDPKGPIVADADFDFVGAGYPMEMKLSLDCWIDPNATASEIGVPALQVDVYGVKWRLGEVQALPQQNLPPGQERRIPTSFDGGANPWPSSFEDGRAVVPPGAKIPMQSDFGVSEYDDIVETTRPFRVGDYDVYCKFSDTISLSPVPALQVPIFFPDDETLGPSDARDFSISITPGVNTQVTLTTYLPTTQIDNINLKLKSRQGLAIDQTEQFGVAFDNVQVSFLLDGELIRELTWAAQTGKDGRKMESPAVRFGDGPQEISRGAITFDNGETTLVDDELGWKRGPWSGGSPNGRRLAQHRARELLRQRTSGTEEHELEFALRSGDDWTPDSIVQWTAANGDTLSLWRRYVEWSIRSGRLRIPSFDLYQDGDSGIYTTLSSVQ
jgi:hypothetical protein